MIYGATSKGTASSQLINKIASGNIVAYTSTLTWDEVVWAVLKLMGRNDALESSRKFLKFPNLRFIDVGESV